VIEVEVEMTARHAHTMQAPDEVLDPVCGMTIAPDDAVGHANYKGQTYYFCSQSCLQRFQADPAAFLESPQTAAPPAAPSGRDDRCLELPVETVRARSLSNRVCGGGES
jgi:YHS domain-containing protein